ncbi:hypothetical protein [Chromobacterium haemolyticum]|uniref:hypothetical protein n=1 Tax=Chromobacterium haemolyticum TaxID=394935 RepID=UPI0020CB3785|nr:hypothetical protein [Chromobacterium haemolyticum]
MKQATAAAYCGMSDKKFRELVLPHLNGLQLFEEKGGGVRQILHYDRADIDAWIDRRKQELIAQHLQSKEAANEPAPSVHLQNTPTHNNNDGSGKRPERKTTWHASKSPDSRSARRAGSGSLTNKSRESAEFAKALELTTARRRKNT